MSPLKEDARIEKNNGSIVGSYKTTFAGDTIIIWDARFGIDAEKGQKKRTDCRRKAAKNTAHNLDYVKYNS